MSPDERLDELCGRIRATHWFEKLGQFPAKRGRFVGIPDLTIWGAAQTVELLPSAEVKIPHDDAFIERFGPMAWLDVLEEADDEASRELLARKQKRGMSKAAFKKIRRVAEASLKSAKEAHLLIVTDEYLAPGSHRFLPAARQSALYAIERCAEEINSGDEGVWCEIVTLLLEGFWPLGILPSGEIVVL